MTNVQFYYKGSHQKENVDVFKRWATYYGLALFQPSSSNPWHVQTEIGKYSLYPQTLNFWPHKLKGYWEGTGTVVGISELTRMLREALDAAEDHIDLIE